MSFVARDLVHVHIIRKMAVAVKSVADSVPFSDFCSILEKINATKGNDKKKGILKRFIDHWREAHRSLHGSDCVPNNVSFY